MRVDAILINGVSLPYHVLDKYISQDRPEQSSARVVFIYESGWEYEDYGFTRDVVLTRPRYTEYSAEENLDKLIHTNIEYVKSIFRKNNIPFEVIIMKNPTSSQVVELMNDVHFIYLDHDTFTHPDELLYVNFSYEDLDEELSFKLQWCRRDRES